MTVSSQHVRGSALAEMNVVPLIDILLVLLVIFMVISPAMNVGLHASVPAISGQAGPGPIVVRILADGSLRINDEAVSWETLQARLQVIFAHRPSSAAFVEGMDETQFSEVARAIGVMHQAGIAEVGLLSHRDLRRTQ